MHVLQDAHPVSRGKEAPSPAQERAESQPRHRTGDNVLAGMSSTAERKTEQ